MASPWKVFMDAFKKASTNKIDATEEARQHGMLGPTTQDASGSFDPIQRPAPSPDDGSALQGSTVDTVAMANAAGPVSADDVPHVDVASEIASTNTATAQELADRLKSSTKQAEQMQDFVRGREAPAEDGDDAGPLGVLADIGKRTTVNDAHDRYANAAIDEDAAEEPATLIGLNPRGAAADLSSRASVVEGPPEEEEPTPFARRSSDPEEGGEYKFADVRTTADPEEGGEQQLAGIRMSADPEEGGEYKFAGTFSGDTVEPAAVFKTAVPDWKLAAEQKLADDLKIEDYKFQMEVKSGGDQKIQRVLEEDRDGGFGEHKISGLATASSGEEVTEGVGEAPSDVQEGVKIDIDRFGADLAGVDVPDVVADQAIGDGRRPGLQQVYVEDEDGEPVEEDGRFGRPGGDDDGGDDEDGGTLVRLQRGRSVEEQLAESRERLAGLGLGDVESDIDDGIDDDADL